MRVWGHLGAGFPREGDLRVNLNKKQIDSPDRWLIREMMPTISLSPYLSPLSFSIHLDLSISLYIYLSWQLHSVADPDPRIFRTIRLWIILFCIIKYSDATTKLFYPNLLFLKAPSQNILIFTFQIPVQCETMVGSIWFFFSLYKNRFEPGTVTICQK